MHGQREEPRVDRRAAPEVVSHSAWGCLRRHANVSVMQPAEHGDRDELRRPLDIGWLVLCDRRLTVDTLVWPRGVAVSTPPAALEWDEPMSDNVPVAELAMQRALWIGAEYVDDRLAAH